MRHRKKPVVIDAFLWTGGLDQTEDPVWCIAAIKTGDVFFVDGCLKIKTLEGTMSAQPGDWIIRGVNGELYPCKPDIFAKTYEAADGVAHGDMVKMLAKPGVEILADMTPHTAHLVHMTLGISGEAGELLDAVKKAVIYNKPLDRANVLEELGDLEFYLEGLRQELGITREETLAGNIAKLAVRYQGLQYTDKAAQARADKA